MLTLQCCITGAHSGSAALQMLTLAVLQVGAALRQVLTRTVTEVSSAKGALRRASCGCVLWCQRSERASFTTATLPESTYPKPMPHFSNATAVLPGRKAMCGKSRAG